MITIVLIMAMVILWNCAPQVTLGPAHLIYPEIRPIEIELKNFSFYPDHIAVLRNHSPLTFRLTNTANILHNFTLTDDHRSILLSIDVGPKESIAVPLQLSNPGNYTFYCNRFLHRFRGMEGMVMMD